MSQVALWAKIALSFGGSDLIWKVVYTVVILALEHVLSDKRLVQVQNTGDSQTDDRCSIKCCDAVQKKLF